jgi:hypothetical protein
LFPIVLYDTKNSLSEDIFFDNFMMRTDGGMSNLLFSRRSSSHCGVGTRFTQKGCIELDTSVAGSPAKADWADGPSYYFGWAELESRGSPDPWAA